MHIDSDRVLQKIAFIASFIASHNPATPYSLLGFYPHFHMQDLPLFTRSEAERCYNAAKEAGLQHVHLANKHLLI